MGGEFFLGNCVVVTLNQNNDIIENGAILVRCGIIEAIGQDIKIPEDFTGPVRD